VGKVSLNQLAIVLGLVGTIGGCAFGPGRDTSSTGIQLSEVDPGVNPTISAGTDRATHPAVTPAFGYEAEDESGAVMQVSAESFGDPDRSITGRFKSGIDKVSQMLTPKVPVKPAEDPTSLSSRAKPSAGLYTAMGRLSEQSNKLVEAEARYQQALKLSPEHPGALIAYARLKDRLGQFDEATRLYQRAAKAIPNDPSIFNDLGLCFARRGMLRESLSALGRAIQLQPKRALYRNNVATVLVEMGRIDAAFTHLRAVQAEAVACYNLGYLMQKKGDLEVAERLFAKALEKDPSLTEAKTWIERLRSRSAPESQMVSQPAPDETPEGRSVGNLSARISPRRPLVPRLPPVTPDEVPATTASELRIPEVRQLPPVPEKVGRSHPGADPPMPPSASIGGRGSSGAASGAGEPEFPRPTGALPPDPGRPTSPMPIPAYRVPLPSETGPAAPEAPPLPAAIQPLPPVEDAIHGP